MFRRRRPLVRAAIVGGTAYAVGKHVQGNRDARCRRAGSSRQADAACREHGGRVYTSSSQLADAEGKGVITDAEFEVQKHKLLERT